MTTETTAATTDDGPAEAPARTIDVYVPNPSHGPVHVEDGTPLIHPDTRSVNDSPLIQALLAAGRLREVPAKKKPRARGKETS